MRDALARRDLRLCGSDILGQFCALDKRFIRFNGEENRRTPTMLRQNEGAPGELNLLDKCRYIRAELGKRANVLAGTTLGHSTSINLYEIMYKWCQMLSSSSGAPGPASNESRLDRALAKMQSRIIVDDIRQSIG